MLNLLSPAFAEQAPWYEVEIILFTYQDANTAQEKWPDDPGVPEEENMIELLQNDNALYPSEDGYQKALETVPPAVIKQIPKPYTLLKPDVLRLKEEARAIQRSSSRKLLFHAGWIQPVFPREKAPAIHLQAGSEFTVTVLQTGKNGGDGRNHLPKVEEGMSSPETGMETSNSKAIIQPSPENPEVSGQSIGTPWEPGVETYVTETRHEVEGILRISISRYLHIWTDLVNHRAEMVPVLDQPERMDSVVKAYRFEDHRRMRSKELHYIDNPLFGLLILFTPYELPETGSGLAPAP